MAAMVLNSGKHAVVELLDHFNEGVWASEFGHDSPEFLAAESVKCLC